MSTTAIVISVITLILGFIGGVVFSRTRMISVEESHSIKQQADEAKSALNNYQAEVSNHLGRTSMLMDQMAETYREVLQHMTETSQVLQKAQQDKDSNMPFFSRETTEALQASLSQLEEPKRKRTKPSEQPRDYSGQPSGLFNEKDTAEAEKE